MSNGPSTEQLLEAAGTLESGGTASTSGQIPCFGDGVSGARVQMVYAVASDRPDRYASLLDTFPVYAARTNAVFANSAANYGVSRNLRFVHTSDCRLDVLHVVLSPTGDDTFSATVTELQNLGLTRTDRKYLVWVDASIYCGIANVVQDESSGSTNRANLGPAYARVDAPCWGAYNSVEAHEISHTLGVVQLGAPNSNGAWHCADESDRMCYDDGSGATMRTVCLSGAEGFLDCGGDDYFNPNPVPGSYLATHWNLADSVFLSSQPPGSPDPSATPSPSPTTTATASPAPTPTSCSTSTASFSGSLNKKQLERNFPVATAAGPLQADMTISKGKSMRLTLLDQNGSTLASSTGMSPLHLGVAALPSGSYSLHVDGNSTGSFALTVKYCVARG
jgi:hypothetical protein